MKGQFKSMAVFYQGANDLIAALKSEGNSQVAYRFHEFVHATAWSTNSELVGEMGLFFNQLEESFSENISL